MIVHLGQKYCSLHETIEALGCTYTRILEMSSAGEIKMYWDNVMISRVPRRFAKAPFFLLSDVDRIQARQREMAFA